MKDKNVYEVSWTIKMTRLVGGYSKEEAIAISEEMGFMGDDASFDTTPMKAKIYARAYM